MLIDDIFTSLAYMLLYVLTLLSEFNVPTTRSLLMFNLFDVSLIMILLLPCISLIYNVVSFTILTSELTLIASFIAYILLTYISSDVVLGILIVLPSASLTSLIILTTPA